MSLDTDPQRAQLIRDFDALPSDVEADARPARMNMLHTNASFEDLCERHPSLRGIPHQIIVTTLAEAEAELDQDDDGRFLLPGTHLRAGLARACIRTMVATAGAIGHEHWVAGEMSDLENAFEQAAQADPAQPQLPFDGFAA